MQPDLFENLSSVMSQFPRTRLAFFERYRVSVRLDQVLAGLIILLVLYALVFSWGVEAGRRASGRELAKAIRELDGTGIPAVPEEAPRRLPEARARENEPSRPLIETYHLSPARGPEQEAAAPSIPLAPVLPEPQPVGAVPMLRPDGKYTIQLITYKSQQDAERQIKRLADAGYQGFVISSGSFLQVCVNGFANSQEAHSVLKRLQGQGLAPRDAYIRPIQR